MTKARTLLVTQWFEPEPIEIPGSIARGLRDQGHGVEVLTGMPNYPHGTVAEGYRAWRPRTDVIHGMRVNRTPLFPSHDASPIKRMTNYLSWAASSTLLAVRRIRRADVCLVYSSPATAALAPAVWSRVLKTPYVLMIQDLWPDSVTSSGMVDAGRVTRFMTAALHRFVNWTYRRAAHIVVISPGMAGLLESRGVPADKITLVYNWAVREDAAANAPTRREARAALGIAPHKFVVTYAGNLGAAQGLHTLVEAARLLAARPEGEAVQIVVAGSGVAESDLRQQAVHAGLTNITFLGHLGPESMRSLRAATDVQFASLVDEPLFAVTMPSKVQAILAAGQPVVVAIPGDAANVVEEHDAGWTVPPGDAQGLASALHEASCTDPSLLATKGENGRRVYDRSMSREVGSRTLSRVLTDAVKRPTYRRTT